MPSPQPTPNFDITVHSDDTAHVVRVEGELDITTRPRLEAAFAGLTRPPMIVILDATALDFIDSTGLRGVLEEHRRARAQGYEFVVAGATGSVREVLRITALDITLPMAPDVASVTES